MIDLSQVTEILLGSSVVEQITNSRGDVLWTATPAVEYFYIEDASGSDNTLSIIKEGSNTPTTEIFKSTDQTTWESMGNTDTTAITATVPANGKLYLKAVTSRLGSGFYYGTKISCTGNYNIGGYLTSLIFGDDFETNTLTGKSEQTFYNLFKNSVNLISAGKLIMPTTSLRRSYSCMFYGCTSLTTAPSLSQTAVNWGCFSEMFSGCTSLTTAPALPATTLGISCYQSMFQGCTSLTTAPELPATTLGSSCYQSMFQGCTSLTTAPELPATTLANSCYFAMFRDCTSLTATPTFVATQADDSSYFAMFERCTSLTTVAPLPNASRSGNPYRYMFTTCPLINSITTYFTGDYTNQDILEGWLTNVSATGNFYNLGGATFASGVSGIPTGWTEHRANCNVSISAGSNGSVSVNGVSGDYSQSVAYNTQLTLVATPDSGYAFGSWSDGDTNATRTITVTNDLTLTASFEVYTGVPDYHIQYTTTDNNQLSLSNSVITNHTFTNGVGDITINTTTLPARFFENKTTLRTLAYGGNIEFANGGYQHSRCENLESVDLPANMTYIPQRWFRTCRKLSRLDLPVSAMTWNISWPFYYTATQTTEGVLHVYVHNSTTLPTIDYTRYGTPKDSAFYITGNNGGADGTNIENLIRLYVPSSLYNDYITTAPHSSVASCISSY